MQKRTRILILSALWFWSVGRWQDVLQHSTVLYFFALLLWVLNTQLKTLTWGIEGPFNPLLTTDTGWSVEENCSGFQYLGLAIFSGSSIAWFPVSFSFLKIYLCHCPKTAINHNLSQSEINSKYRLNIFQLSVNDNLE